MKFGKQLQLGTYEPWKQYYIQYDKLKRLITKKKFFRDQEKEKKSEVASSNGADSRNSNHDVTEHTPLREKNQLFTNHSYSQNGKNESKDDSSLDFFPLIMDETAKINNFFIGKLAELRIFLEEIMSSRKNAYRTHHSGGDQSFLLKLREIYLELAALRSFCDLNQTGFYKIIKKYDKIMGENTLDTWMSSVNRLDFTKTHELVKLMDVVTSLVSRDKLMEWEKFATEQNNKISDDIFPSVRFLGLFISLAIFIISLEFPILNPADVEANRCMSLVLLSVSLWITEAIPYYATALLIPPLVTYLGVLKDEKDPTKPMERDAAANFVMNHIFNHTTMLLLGGYTISSAFSRCQLELRMASYLQNKFSNRPLLFMLAVMFFGLFLSMWINNHTAPILCSTIILPIVRDLPTDSRFSKALLLGLAYGCNFGGMMTPISSLQNVMAVSYLEQISFGKWILFSIPFCLVCTIISWMVIILLVNPNDVETIPVIVYERNNKVFGKRNLTVLIMSLLTICMFASVSKQVKMFGDIGIISLCYVGFMYGSGILSEVDFNSLSWHTLFLVGGGNVLGKAVESSGLLSYFSNRIITVLPLHHPWLALVYILSFTATIATFVSHTVASLILMPVISSIGITMGIPEVVVIGSALSISAAMALPFSSFPNVNSLLMVDDFQASYLNSNDFLKTGLIMTIISVVLISTLGYSFIMVIIGM